MRAIFAAAGTDQAILSYWQMAMSLQSLNANAGGTGQPYVNQKHLNELAIPLPPQDEQVRVTAELADRLSICDQAAAQVRLNITRCGRLRQSILTWAFEGKLVDQDPADEPASVLLARVKAERDAAEGMTKDGRPGRRTKRNV